MKTLPDNPNLDHLRRQAKDLLTGLRDSAPTTTLAQAQALLAEQYGFGSWPELKAEVDRQRGRADVADPELARALADQYGLGEVTGAMQSLARPDELGRRWSLSTDRGRWLVRNVDGWIRIVDVETDVALQLAAAAAGVLVPTPVRSSSGAIVESIGGHDWRVYEWLHSGPPLVAPVGASVTRRVGEVLATVHQLRLPVDRISPWHASRLSDVEWPALLAKARASQAEWSDVLAEAIPTLADLAAIGAAEPVADPVLCHNALGPSNALLGPDGRLVVVGWEHAGGQPPQWELADALMHWTVNPSGGVNRAGARAMVEGYESVAGVIPTLDLAAFSGAATSLVNFVSGELSEAFRAQIREEKRYADRSIRHLLTHLPTRAVLMQIIDAIGDGSARPDSHGRRSPAFGSGRR